MGIGDEVGLEEDIGVDKGTVLVFGWVDKGTLLVGMQVDMQVGSDLE